MNSITIILQLLLCDCRRETLGNIVADVYCDQQLLSLITITTE